MNFGKVLTAMVTPFDKHEEIDFQALDYLIDHLINNGSDGLVVAGTTGESPTLTHGERMKLFEYVVKKVNGAVPVIAGTGSNYTKASIELTKEVSKTGVDGVMLVAPYYNKPSQDSMYEHFKVIAESTELPVMLYNVPGRTGVDMDVSTVVRLSQIDNIVSIKDASGNLEKMTNIIRLTDENFSVYSGEDSLTLPALAIGAAGIVSVSSHIIGNDMQEMIHRFEQGQVAEAANIHQRVLPVMQEMFANPSPVPVKTALNIQSVPVGKVRLPLIELNDEQLQNLQSVLSDFEHSKMI
ncbi:MULTISPECIES: 4-hydroxy-tetrahydrodipicolinate synthase [Oceanobacillus]|uniref:4-hydroxy-tetrahydrodipicolinate synthase n=1 Tax=Oceanobacillus kimchii TaxID=746691 RepID=A0ABQ5TL41_9BACI|nr:MULTISPECIES: 4-hydroxy-tetrahydrodipicolinate synthase [Oceanobacillus]MBT2598544.1 4-hydroxy-tetrahydrodipicolinate synthase [Oceanobacillus sp. ISL-74]MBT2651462.1 4-hydroxy-tetrahydrodipicolinate synthase [Oceanobacillus sp. ISL-73]MCT1576119.1 4-hydroxy-tetrahydrodipicolinate synthase [Oceanobacillus kimchii]MCT2135756.1 4-hydroxy-tetrahydrodipicolinate synthase [Oceanobacillus kimchii]OEH55849.1 4-hydroxy-tetrahydrodipicolinate synthase [Oceanobacillus sp. E9]